MLTPFYTKQFKKDVKRLEKSGRKGIEAFKRVIRLLIDEGPLDQVYHDHSLKGDYKNRRECHIEPDWLLVYQVNKREETIIFERTGSHADIFE